MNNNNTINWLLSGDVSVQYQVNRDLLNSENRQLRNRISKEGWGARFLQKRKKEGHWGRGFYQPKWTSTHYTILDMKNLGISPTNKEIKQTITSIINSEKGPNGGIYPTGTTKNSDVCINGMFLNYACYFQTNKDVLKSIVDFLINEHMNDGGFNCYSNRSCGAIHSSVHSTISVLEGIYEYNNNGYKYRLKELLEEKSGAIEFLLTHKLFKSHRSGTL